MRIAVKTDPHGAHYLSVSEKGRALLLNPLTNKGTAFTEEERDTLDLRGLLPPVVSTMERQLERTYGNFVTKATPLEKYIYLSDLQDRNTTLFYRLALEHIDEMMPVLYTPVVGEACQMFSRIYRRPRGLYLDIEQRGRLAEILRRAGPARASVIVVTDGERILGLGDQGAGGMGIPIGKLCLYTLCAGVPPADTIPIMLDVGTENAERLADPLYVGLRRRRARGAAYQAFIDEFVEAVHAVWPDALLQWEDFLKENALFQLDRFRDRLCTFNDDIQGTAAVVVAGLLAALRITRRPWHDQRVLIAGAGASAQGIASLIVSAFVEGGVAREEAVRRIWTTDSKGLVTRDRPGLEAFKAAYARGVEEVAGWRRDDAGRIPLLEAVARARPTILIGTSGTPGTFTREVVAEMARVNERPVIFPLSNPTSKSECTAEEAVRWSDGRAIVATGSPFAPVEHAGRRHRIGQCNNAFVFPGIGLGSWVARARRVTDGVFLEAAKALAAEVRESDLVQNAVYPELSRVRDVSHAVAVATARRAVEEGHADPEILEGLPERIRAAMWYPAYLPVRYEP